MIDPSCGHSLTWNGGVLTDEARRYLLKGMRKLMSDLSVHETGSSFVANIDIDVIGGGPILNEY